MSCFLVDKTTVDRVVWLAIGQGETCPDDLGNRLIHMNNDAYDYRYNDTADEQMDYEYASPNCTVIQAIKSADCLLYQCSEGPVTESGDYKTLEKIFSLACRQYVRDTDEYDKALWE